MTANPSPARDIWPSNKEKQAGTITRNRVLNEGQEGGKVFREIE